MDEETSEDLAFPSRPWGNPMESARGLFEKAQDSGFRKHATFAPAKSVLLFCEGFWMEKTVWRRSGHGSSPKRWGERSLKPSRLWLAGAKPVCFWIQKPEHTVFSPTAIRLYTEKVDEGMAW